MPQEDAPVRKLAELKSFLEERVAKSEEEIKRLREFLEVVDTLLTEKSFRRVEVPIVAERTIAPAEVLASEGQQIRAVNGQVLAQIFVSESEVRVVPSKEWKFDVDSPPFRSYLLAKVLEPAKSKDVEAARRGELLPDNAFDFTLDREGNVLREITIKNYGDERRLDYLKGQIRWTFHRMYERILSPGQQPGGR